MEGAVFTAAFGLSSLYPETARFVYTYSRTTGQEPTAIAAQGYDAAGIILEAWDSLSSPTRSRLARKLSSMAPYYGASGRCVLGTVSESRVSWPMMTVIDGEIIGVEPPVHRIHPAVLNRDVQAEGGVERIQEAVPGEDPLPVGPLQRQQRGDHEFRREGQRRGGG